MTNNNELLTQIEGDLVALLDDYHSLPEIWDNELDAQIHRWYSDPPEVWPKRPYFIPSSANACPRELYLKAKRAKKDEFRRQPHQGRWQRIGTQIGDIIQRDLLFIEKHYERMTGNKPRFTFERNDAGQPMFEEFAMKNKRVTHDGETFYLYGAPDGIMRYTTDDGEIVRIGLEVKSKQTTPARTSIYSMRAPEESHVKQCIAYSEMYDVDYYVILYVNAAKKAWEVDEEEYKKTPDLRAFAIEITDEDRAELFNFLSKVMKYIRTNTPPPMDLSKFTFNNYKTACAESLADEEYEEIKTQVKRYLRSSLPDWRKQQYYDAFEFITEVREAGE